jgi:hypothetical protein
LSLVDDTGTAETLPPFALGETDSSVAEAVLQTSVGARGLTDRIVVEFGDVVEHETWSLSDTADVLPARGSRENLVLGRVGDVGSVIAHLTADVGSKVARGAGGLGTLTVPERRATGKLGNRDVVDDLRTLECDTPFRLADRSSRTGKVVVGSKDGTLFDGHLVTSGTSSVVQGSGEDISIPSDG